MLKLAISKCGDTNCLSATVFSIPPPQVLSMEMIATRTHTRTREMRIIMKSMKCNTPHVHTQARLFPIMLA